MKLDFIFFDAGGGHRSAATALEAVIRKSDRQWCIRIVNLQEVLDRLDIFRRCTGIRAQDVYNLVLKRGWTLGSEYLLPLMHGLVRLYHDQQVKVLTEFWTGDGPDMVVSLVPNFNRAMKQALDAARPGTPYVTVLTDFADFPPHFWIERQEQFLICGTERAREQALEMGHAAERVFTTSGMILRPGFYDPPETGRAGGRARLGLDPDLPTGLVLFGGQGSAVMTEIARSLDRPGLQMIFICGHNTKLAERLRAFRPAHMRMHVEGFTKEIPFYMRLSDFLIGKPGPGSISEAVAMGLPVIVERNHWTLPQERYNCDWVREKRAGIVLSHFRGIAKAVDGLLEPGTLGEFRSSVAAIRNRAVFEIPDILERIACAHSLSRSPSPH